MANQNSIQNNEQAPSKTFGFVQLLAQEVSEGKLEVPGFPDVAMRVRRALDDPNCTAASVATIVSAEPVLTARLLRLANSAALRPVATAVKDPKTAVSRLGFALVRSATVAFAVAQMRMAHRYEAAKARFATVWQHSTGVAAVAHVLAKRCKGINPDEALLAGLMHAIGKLYILSRAADHPALFQDEAELGTVLEEWYVPTGEAILQNWGFSEDIVRAVAAQKDLEREIDGPTDLADLLIVALPLPAALGSRDDLALLLEATRASERLRMTTNTCVSAIEEAHDQIAELQKTLGE
jgi:HD-like signal output (HDOD) protein